MDAIFSDGQLAVMERGNVGQYERIFVEPSCCMDTIEHWEIVAELKFHNAFGIDPIVIPDEVLGQRRMWRELGVLVAKADCI